MSASVAILALLTALLIPINPAEAGGAHVEWEDKFSIPGKVVRGHALVRLDNPHDLKDGPYYAHLSKNDSTVPPLPQESRRLARIGIDPRPGGKRADVTIEFVLPPLDSGYYWILNCNDPCRKNFGDLTVGQINVVTDKSEARVLDLAFRIAREVHVVDQRLQRKVLGSRRFSLATQVAELQERVHELEGQTQNALDSDQSAPSTSAYPIGAFVLASAAAGAVIVSRKRRHRQRPQHK